MPFSRSPDLTPRAFVSRATVPIFGSRSPRSRVVYVDVTTSRDDARECAERLRKGSGIGLSGRLEDDPYEGAGVLIDALDFS
jgi:single-stranded DNA-binding protein